MFVEIVTLVYLTIILNKLDDISEKLSKIIDFCKDKRNNQL